MPSVKEYRGYHDYLLRNGFTVVGSNYYKDGCFYTPHFYNDFCSIEEVRDGVPMGFESEQMLYGVLGMVMEGGMAS